MVNQEGIKEQVVAKFLAGLRDDPFLPGDLVSGLEELAGSDALRNDAALTTVLKEVAERTEDVHAAP